MANAPAVSVIIPLYNAERYISECLDTILAQTFQDFEVIVVDDCSTDNSCAIVESYIPKFDGRLILSSMEKNSGAPPAPRNKGFIISRSEYVFFMDNDDALTKTALEEMYTLAKTYEADVVYCEKYFMSTGDGQEFKDNIHIADSRIQPPPFVSEPTFISEDPFKRMQEWFNRKFWMTPWLRLVSRKLLAENRIIFPEIAGSDDDIWALEVLFLAKKFLRVPNTCYIRRMRSDSLSRSKKAVNRHVRQWMDKTIRGLKITDDFMNRLEFFKNNPFYRYKVLNTFLLSSFNNIFYVCSNLQPQDVYEVFLNEFSDEMGENDVLIACLCAQINHQQKVDNLNHEKFKEFAAQSKKELQVSRQKFKELAEQVQLVIDDLEQKNK